ncbi:MAG TPA: ATP-binding protein [Methylomirabilota bacterium]|nr:ATP-binding protein [Methylomirabilota bacterium]
MPALPRLRLVVRLTLAVLAVTAAGTASMALYVTPILERRVVESLRAGLLTSARLLEDALRPPRGATRPPAELRHLVERYAATVGARLTVIAPDGSVLADSAHDPETMENHATRPEVATALAGGPGSDIRQSRTLDVPMLYVAVPLGGPDRPGGVIRLAMPLTAVSHAAAEVRRTVIAGAALAVALSLGFAVFVTRRITRPVTRMRVVARQMAQGNLAQQVRVTGDDEIAELGEALNQMAAALRAKMAALETERAEVAAILDGMVEGVIALDHRGRTLLMNPAARRILHVPPDEAVAGRALLEVVRQKALADVAEGARRAAPGAPSSHEIELGPPIGRVLRAHAAAVPLAGPEAGTVLVLHDVTELRRLERVRAEFVANVSHELRTPLTAIRGYLETLLEERLEEPAHARRFLAIAHTHAVRLGRLVDDLLQLSDVESGRAVPVPTRVALREATALVTATFEREVARRGLQLENRVPADLAVRADPDRVSQILVNLVDNAVKYTPAGGRIAIRAERRDRWVETAVSDTGIGIPPRDLPRISERFYRVDKARSRELGGTGLGLAIVKHLVHAHGGELAIESEPGSGTTVRFTLPAA